jgi:hypothetical protein
LSPAEEVNYFNGNVSTGSSNSSISSRQFANSRTYSFFILFRFHRLHPISFESQNSVLTMPASNVSTTRHSARQAAKTSSSVRPSRKRTAVAPAAKKKKPTSFVNNKKKKRASTSSAAILPPTIGPPGPPPTYPRRNSAPPAIEAFEATVVESPPASLEGDSTVVKIKLDEEGQILSEGEIFAYADAIAYKRSVGSIRTDQASGMVIVDPIQGSDKPSGDSLNDASAWTSFALSDDSDLFGQETDSMIHDSGNVKHNDKQKIGAFARFIRCIANHDGLSQLAELVVDSEGGLVMRFILILRGSKTTVKMHLLNTLMLAWSYDFHKLKIKKENAVSTYQPNYTDKVIRQIFKCLHDSGITMNHSDFKSFIGSYWSYFKGRFAIAIQVRSDFGRNPFRAAVEYDDEIKMRTNATPKFEVTTCYNDNLEVALYKVTRDFMNRGGCEVS